MKVHHILCLTPFPKVIVEEILRYAVFSVSQFVIVKRTNTTVELQGSYYTEYDAVLQLVKQRIKGIQAQLQARLEAYYDRQDYNRIRFLDICIEHSWSDPDFWNDEDWFQDLCISILPDYTLLELHAVAKELERVDYQQFTILELTI